MRQRSPHVQRRHDAKLPYLVHLTTFALASCNHNGRCIRAHVSSRGCGDFGPSAAIQGGVQHFTPRAHNPRPLPIQETGKKIWGLVVRHVVSHGSIRTTTRNTISRAYIQVRCPTAGNLFPEWRTLDWPAHNSAYVRCIYYVYVTATLLPRTPAPRRGARPGRILSSGWRRPIAGCGRASWTR